MNTCILMAQIVREPELRYTQENQTPLTTMLVQFDGPRPEDPPSNLKVVAWGENLAPKVQQNYVKGDRVIIKGSLRMDVIDRPEGFKEKLAELTVSEIYLLSRDGESLSSSAPTSTPRAANVVSRETSQPPSVPNQESDFSSSDRGVETVPSRVSPADRDLDDIPFVRSVDSRTASFGLLDFYEIESQCPQVGISHNFKFI